MTELNRRLAAVATGQQGLITRSQARELGVTDAQLRSRVSSGFLLATGPNAFRLVGAPTEALDQLRALVLDIGGDVVACRATAAALHGFDGFHLRPPFDLAVGRGRHVNRIGHRIHTITRLERLDRGAIGPIPVTRGARTLVDLARTETSSTLTACYDSGLRDGCFTERSLHERIVALRRSGRAGIRRLLAVVEGIEVTRGGHSWLERAFLELIADAGLPRPTPQVVLTRAGDRFVRVDFEFPGTDVVVEVLGYSWHRTRSQLRRDAERLNALLDIGRRPYQFTYEQVVEDAPAVVRTLAAALAR